MIPLWESLCEFSSFTVLILCLHRKGIKFLAYRVPIIVMQLTDIVLFNDFNFGEGICFDAADLLFTSILGTFCDLLKRRQTESNNNVIEEVGDILVDQVCFLRLL